MCKICSRVEAVIPWVEKTTLRDDNDVHDGLTRISDNPLTGLKIASVSHDGEKNSSSQSVSQSVSQSDLHYLTSSEWYYLLAYYS